MIVDLILDRKDGFTPYNAHDFYFELLDYGGIFGTKISRLMDFASESEVKRGLCEYIMYNKYNPKICDYINSVEWLTD